MEQRESFVFYRSFFEAIEEIPKEHQLDIYKAICDYCFEGKLPNEISGTARALFILMKPNIDSATRRYNTSVENGKKGGAPKGNQNAKKETKNNLKTTQKQPRNNLNDNVNVNDNDNVNDNVNDKVYECLEENFGRTISPLEYEKLNEWLLLFNSDVIEYAIELAVLNDKKTFAYLNGIINNFKSYGVVELKDIKDKNDKNKGGNKYEYL